MLDMIELGELIGRYFCAWTIVLDTQVMYEPLFKEYLLSDDYLRELKPDETNQGNQLSKQSDAQIDFRLQAGLNDSQLLKLYDLLIKKNFISSSTDKDSFDWTFGDTHVELPAQWKAIIWKDSKKSLRELLEKILHKITNQHIRKIAKLFCDINYNSIYLNKPKKENSARILEIEEIIKELSL